jgi:DNA-binding LytR/AlgR family response regulator
MLRIAICDDEERYVSDVKCMLQKWATEVSAYIQIYCFHDGDSLIQEAETIQFDIVFLDIVMPLINGFDTAKELRSKDKTVKIIFLTSSPEFALQSYSVKATNYYVTSMSIAFQFLIRKAYSLYAFKLFNDSYFSRRIMFYLEEHNPQANRESSSFPGRNIRIDY